MKKNKFNKKKTQLSIVIVSYNTKTILMNCLRSVIKNTKGLSYELIVVENGSTDGSVEILNKLAKKHRIKIIKNKINLGFGVANNQGVKIAKGRYILFLNSDTILKSNLLKNMCIWMERNRQVGVATCLLKNEDGSIQGTGGYFPTLLRVFSWMIVQDLPFVDRIIKPFHPMKEKSFNKAERFYSKQKQLDWVTGAFLLTRSQILMEVGYFDEDYFMYMEEVDLCYRIKNAGWEIWYLPSWSIIHLGGASATREFSVINEFKSIKLFYKKHFSSWQYPILRILLKTGAALRVILFRFTEGAQSSKIYAKAFKIA